MYRFISLLLSAVPNGTRHDTNIWKNYYIYVIPILKVVAIFIVSVTTYNAFWYELNRSILYRKFIYDSCYIECIDDYIYYKIGLNIFKILGFFYSCKKINLKTFKLDLNFVYNLFTDFIHVVPTGLMPGLYHSFKADQEQCFS